MAVFVSMLMVFHILPLTVFANEYQNSLLLRSPVDSDTPYDDLTIVDEAVEERDEYSKMYLLENGMYCELSSITPIHEEVNDEWIEMNPSNNTPPDIINDASISLSSLADDNSDNFSEPTLNDGLVIQNDSSNLNIYGAELTENENGDYVLNITSIYSKWENGSKENNGLIIQTEGTENIYAQ